MPSLTWLKANCSLHMPTYNKQMASAEKRVESFENNVSYFQCQKYKDDRAFDKWVYMNLKKRLKK